MSPTRRQPAHELRRAGLTRDRVLGTAVELADEEGLDGLSMRKLAKRLGVEAMSLYNHIPRQGTLAGRHGRSGIWRDRAAIGREAMEGELRNRAISTRAALKRHSWAVGLMEARANPGEANFGCMRRCSAVCARPDSRWRRRSTPTRSKTPTSMDSHSRSGRLRSRHARSG